MGTHGPPPRRLAPGPALPRKGQAPADQPGISLNMPLLEVVRRLRPMARFQKRFLHDPEMEDVLLSAVVLDPDGAWQELCLTPGAGPATRAVICEVVTEALTRALPEDQRAVLSSRQIARVLQVWSVHDSPGNDPPLPFRSQRRV
ncbi:MAG: hypothetical protein ACXIVG_04925 [Pararhodobacter sp.]